MKTETTYQLYIKPPCPWCKAAIAWLDDHGITYEKIDVLSDPEAYQEMIAFSGQDKTPTLRTSEGKVLADFDADELPAFLGVE